MSDQPPVEPTQPGHDAAPAPAAPAPPPAPGPADTAATADPNDSAIWTAPPPLDPASPELQPGWAAPPAATPTAAAPAPPTPTAAAPAAPPTNPWATTPDASQPQWTPSAGQHAPGAPGAPGAGWWLASDGNWYPPPNPWVQGPDGQFVAAPQQAYAPQQPYAQPQQQPFAQPQPQYAQPQYGQQPFGAVPYGQQYGTAQQPVTTNGLAIASLVLGIVWVFWIGSFFAIVLGFVAVSQINRSGGRQTGKGLAIAGIVLGFAGMVLLVFGLIGAASDANNTYGFLGPWLGAS